MKKNSLSILLAQQSIQSLFDIFESESKEICLVGGCIRDALIGKINTDIDIAINSDTDNIIEILKRNKLFFEDYAYRYGSINAYIGNKKFQITTLREDINQTGRHTDIIFTQDWKKDALRRDFTINAIYLSRNGKVKDFFNGQEDLIDSSLRFIGNIEDRVQQDFLRIFRYYRFLGVFKNPNLIRGYDEILLYYLNQSLGIISNDLIRQEILKMFNSSFPLNSFFKNKKTNEKKQWVEVIKKHFTQTGYLIGLNKCLNKIDLLINSKESYE